MSGPRVDRSGDSLRSKLPVLVAIGLLTGVGIVLGSEVMEGSRVFWL